MHWQSIGLPGRIELARGTARDYRRLAHFHYLPQAPATFAGVWIARYLPRDPEDGPHPSPPPEYRGRGKGNSPPLLAPPLHRGRGKGNSPPLLPPPVLRGRVGVGVLTSLASQSHPNSLARVIAVGVLSWPTPRLLGREKLLNLAPVRYGPQLAFLNAHLRTISRVIVHPQFRGLGLGTALVKWMCEQCTTRWVEAIAMMGHFHPLFAAAGMTAVFPDSTDQPVYFLFDRQSGREQNQNGGNHAAIQKQQAHQENAPGRHQSVRQ